MQQLLHEDELGAVTVYQSKELVYRLVNRS